MSFVQEAKTKDLRNDLQHSNMDLSWQWPHGQQRWLCPSQEGWMHQCTPLVSSGTEDRRDEVKLNPGSPTQHRITLLLYKQASSDHLFLPFHQQQMVHIRTQYILSMARSYVLLVFFFSDFEEYGCLRTDMCFAIRLSSSKHPF